MLSYALYTQSHFFLLSPVFLQRISINCSLDGSFKIYVCLKRFANACDNCFEPTVPIFIAPMIIHNGCRLIVSYPFFFKINGNSIACPRAPIITAGFARFGSSNMTIPPFSKALRKSVETNSGLPFTILVLPSNSSSSVF